MAPTIQQIIATVNPGLYLAVSDKKMEAKKELRDFKGSIKKEGFQKAAESAKPKALAEHKLIYDSSSETLEPIYFFILDLMGDFNFDIEKVTDNFVSSPGSGHFAELGQRATIMQQQGSRIMGDVNNVLRSILNLVYDLKEFKIRLQHYDGLKSSDKEKAEAARLSLKQIWMDKVDIAKGNSSIKAMAIQAGFQTLIDAFLVVNDEKDVDKLDLNDRVKRILKPRIQEFNLWVQESERELRKRYELEKTYLKSQVNSVKIYSRWAKPYLKAAKQLEMKEVGREPALVKTFNTILLELTLFGKTKLKVREAALDGKLPEQFSTERFLKSLKRDYYSCILVNFNFRGIPQKLSPAQPHYVFGGRTEITFSAFALNDDEIKKINDELEKSDVDGMLELIEGATEESLAQLKEDIDSFLKEEPEEAVSAGSKGGKSRDTSNPFLALIGKYEKGEKPPEKTKEGKKEKSLEVKPDNFIEANSIRPLAEENAKDTVFNLFDIYKKAHGMVSYT